MKTSQKGFITLMAFSMSLIALAIDAMMPALGAIGKSLNVTNPNDVQLVISTIFFGMSFGLIIYGPLSDAYGRKKALSVGLIIFLLGCLLSLFSKTFEMMLFGRVLQGFGAAACRVVSVAMIRDRFHGSEMGKVMSMIMMVFILVPTLAPAAGQLVLVFYSWQSIFTMLFILGVSLFLLINFAQEETLKEQFRIPLSFKRVSLAMKETISNQVTRNYTLASALIFGAFIGYLSLAQQIFQDHFALGEAFSFYFGGLALCIGCSSFINSKLVIKVGMEKISLIAIFGLVVISGVTSSYLLLSSAELSLYGLLTFLGLSFLLIGILFGNLNTIAIQPLGHIAGTANSVISSVQTFISVALGASIGQFYSNSVNLLPYSFFVLCSLGLVIIFFTKKVEITTR